MSCKKYRKNSSRLKYSYSNMQQHVRFSMQGYAATRPIISETTCRLVGQGKMTLSHFSRGVNVAVRSAQSFVMLNLEFTKPGKNLLLLTFPPQGSDQFERYYNQKTFQRKKQRFENNGRNLLFCCQNRQNRKVTDVAFTM